MIELKLHVKCGHRISPLQISEVEAMLSVMGVEVTPSESSAQDVSRLGVVMARDAMCHDLLINCNKFLS